LYSNQISKAQAVAINGLRFFITQLASMKNRWTLHFFEKLYRLG